ncbi:MAG: Do family serine endopeptidase [Alphaproteobacteria bacterium]
MIFRASINSGFIAFILILCAVSSLHAQNNILPTSNMQIQLSFAPLVKQVSPAVVNIYTKRVVERNVRRFNDQFLEQFFGRNFSFGRRQRQIESSLGSGVIIDAVAGLIITNNHVIKDASEIRIGLQDRREFDATLLASDEKLDLAILVLKDAIPDLPQARLGNPDQLSVGDLVLAIGNPFGVGQTVTSGIISGLARSGGGISDMQSFIQTDAAINPGNSGGALIAMNGDVIGINTAIFTRSGGSQGIGFAIPANLVSVMVAAAKEGRAITRPWLGINARNVDIELADALALPRPAGVFIDAVRADESAFKAGIRAGDIIIAADDNMIETLEELNYRALLAGIGSQLKIGLLRNGTPQNRTLTLEVAPKIPPAATYNAAGRHPLQGASLSNLSPYLAQQLDMDQQLAGVVIASFAPNSQAARIGFKIRDIIAAINNQPIKDTAQLKSALDRAAPNGRWQIDIIRDGRTRRYEFR